MTSAEKLTISFFLTLSFFLETTQKLTINTTQKDASYMLGRRSNQKTFFDDIVGYYLPDNHLLKVNDIIDWTPIEKA